MKLVEDWRRLSLRNQILAIGATIAVIGAFGMLVRAATEPPMSLLYAGLDAGSAGEILEALEAMGVPAEAKGDAIYVPEPRRDAVRMALAGQGLPRQGQAGFELLDELNAFATTSEMFDATYWRAKEGELARTILATPGVRSARVHISTPKRSAFSRVDPSPRAVVTISMARGALEISRAEAMRFVVALSVPDLAPEQVAVIDAAKGVILAPGDRNDALSGVKGAEGREKTLENDLVSLLEAHVGPGNARVKVAIEVSHDQETLVERTLDPKQRILTNRESSEISESGTDGAGAVTVASNLPEGDIQSSTAPPQSKRNETTESTTFDVAERRRETISTPGAVRRVQVAVLINSARGAVEEGAAEAAPRSPQELDALRKLVAAAVGFNQERGDVVTIESLSFEGPEPLGEAIVSNAAMDFLSRNLMSILQLVIPAIVSLILALFVLKPILSSGHNAPTAPETPLVPAPPQQAAIAQMAQATPVDQMKRVAAEQQTASAAVLKNWLDEKENAA